VPAGKLYLDDLDVGQKFATSTAAVTLEGCTAFAREFDPQEFHLDDDAGRASLFGRLAASGWYTASLTMRLMVQGELGRLAGGLIGLGGELKWSKAVYPGDTLRVESEVLGVKVSQSRPERGVVTVRNTTFNQRGEAVQVMTASMLVPRRPAI
jgi:acyl dehydratase